MVAIAVVVCTAADGACIVVVRLIGGGIGSADEDSIGKSKLLVFANIPVVIPTPGVASGAVAKLHRNCEFSVFMAITSASNDDTSRRNCARSRSDVSRSERTY